MKYGSYRKSGNGTSIQRQISLLRKQGIQMKNIVGQYWSGYNGLGKKISKQMENLKSGDDWFWTDVCRITRGGPDEMSKIIKSVKDKGANIVIINANLDTKIDEGISKIIELSKDAEDTNDNRSLFIKQGLAIAKENGRQLGGTLKKTDEAIRRALEMYDEKIILKEIARETGMNPRTIQRYVKKRDEENKNQFKGE
jgi:DNA invertase Pin-like site-specific DNA recombinase